VLAVFILSACFMQEVSGEEADAKLQFSEQLADFEKAEQMRAAEVVDKDSQNNAQIHGYMASEVEEGYPALQNEAANEVAEGAEGEAEEEAEEASESEAEEGEEGSTSLVEEDDEAGDADEAEEGEEGEAEDGEEGEAEEYTNDEDGEEASEEYTDEEAGEESTDDEAGAEDTDDEAGEEYTDDEAAWRTRQLLEIQQIQAEARQHGWEEDDADVEKDEEGSVADVLNKLFDKATDLAAEAAKDGASVEAMAAAWRAQKEFDDATASQAKITQQGEDGEQDTTKDEKGNVDEKAAEVMSVVGDNDTLLYPPVA